jgi:superfamily II DNA or RNA helicase
VVAAILSVQQPVPVPTTEATWSRVVYRFSRSGVGLELRRFLAHADGRQEPLVGPLTGVLAKPALAARLQVESADLVVDRLLERPMRPPLSPERLDALLTALEGARNVLVEGREVAVTGDVVLPHAVVEDRDGEVVVTITRDPLVTEVLAPGVALCGEVVARLGETTLTGSRLELLPVRRAFTPDQVAELTTRVLPDLAARIPVEVRTRRMPPVDRHLAPRILLDVSHLDTGLTVLPTLVYGSPPCVRIDGARMVYLRGAVPVRDLPAEQDLVARLRDELNMAPGRRVTVTGTEVPRWAERLQTWHASVTGEAAGHVGARVTLVPVIRHQGTLASSGAPQVAFTVEFRVEGPDTPGRHVDGETVVRAWRDGLGLVPLEGGGWAPLPAAWLDEHGERLADLLAARRPDGTLANHALPGLAVLCEALDEPPPLGLERLAPLAHGFDAIPEPVLPGDVTATLRPYQRQGVGWLQFLKRAGLGGILADDMGLGKTLQALCALEGRTLVVCPTSVLPNWEAEAKRFRPGLRTCVYHGPARALDGSAHVTLTTYALVRLDAAVLSATPWGTVILDEAQAIKNPDSQVARAAHALPAAFRLALTGTPLENRLEELWSLVHFTNPGLLGSRRDFEEKVARPVADGNPGAVAALRKRIRPFVMRRLKRDVAPELPPRDEAVLRVALDDQERTIYDAVHAATRADVVALLGGGGNVMQALEALLRLRQAACHPALVPGQVAVSSSKVRRLVEVLSNAAADGHRSLVFSQWTSLLDLVEGPLREAGLAFQRLDGSTANRGDVVARFQAQDGPPVMLISLKAGGTGLNLTAADHVFLLDPWWNPAVEAQAADRAHRLGQDKPVMVYRLVAQGTVEERILLLQDKKRALFQAALGDGGAATSLTRQDLLDLLA